MYTTAPKSFGFDYSKPHHMQTQPGKYQPKPTPKYDGGNTCWKMPVTPTHPDLTGARGGDKPGDAKNDGEKSGGYDNGGYVSKHDPKGPKTPVDPVDPVDPIVPSVEVLPDGLQPGGPTTIADNLGNSVEVTFDADGMISGITTSRVQAEGPDSFSGATFTFDGDANLLTAQSSIAQGQPPVGPEAMNETIAFPNDAPQAPVLNGDGQLVGFAEEAFASNDGDAVRVRLNEQGDIIGFELEERTDLGAFTDLRLRIFDLDGTLVAEAQS